MAGLDQQKLYQQVGQRIRKAREQTFPRMSQSQLAKRLDVSRVSVVNIEAGKQHAPLHLLWRIAEELGTELALLIPRQDELQAQTEITLDAATVASIQAAADGDADTRRLLAEFIAKVQGRSSDSATTMENETRIGG